ncbi:arabinosyltransferase domain-containing protein [Gordonia polyisoprenivorans]|uniref:arabinosyltransferase domain-containing protein n=1 Tax=Gordonia polyisoprenivorans TaxID=84595 RepID=UPI0019FA0A7A|nr:arabinosyltransferase domain-containing protein [Gordonia polyisoprenivorans]MBE7193351.1 arabinosyltransferase domain-containing protein [Gordonia polyisoprenivorans]WCB37877.1 arabinosyltransferase domain-containing protein [Gordonia polyisoprenivorans]
MTEPATPTSTTPDRRGDRRTLHIGGIAIPSNPRTWSIVAVVAGLVAVVAAVLTPFLPVTAHTATITWPQPQSLSVTAPLVAQTPSNLDVTVDCRVLAEAVGKTATGSTVVVSTMPRGAQKATDSGLFITAGSGGVTAAVRNSQLASATPEQLATCQRLHVWVSRTDTGGITHARFVGVPGPAAQGTAEAADQPQVAGLFTDLDSTSGMAARIAVDNRFDTTPSAIKLTVMILGVLAALVAAVAVAALDILGGYHRRIGLPDVRRLLMPRAVDLAVTAVLVVWHFLGAGSPDDGYILEMGRNSVDAGYLADYYRFYGIPEAPFDWYYSFLAHWSQISTAGIWMRLPALVAGLLGWFILSRVLLPRLGGAVRRSQWAMFTAAAVFVAFWMPLDSGLRSEPIIVLGSLLTWWGVEQAIATRRMLPALGATLAAGMTLAAAPQGLIAVAILVAGSRPMLRNVRRRAAEHGLLATLAPVAAMAGVVVIIVFRDQTLAAVAEAIRVRYTVGPVLSWYQEFLRYYYLTLSSQDGTLVRRVPVVLLLAAVFVTIAVMLRRKHVRGVDPAPVWRLIGTFGLSMLLLSFTPTKWTMQFGVYAGVAAALAAVAAVAVAESARRSPRNLCVYIAGLLFACAVAAAGQNAWGWAYDFGISWFDKAPVLEGQQLSSLFLVLTVLALAAAVWFHLRIDVDAEHGRMRENSRTPGWVKTAIASSPMAIIATLVVLIELLLFAKAAVARSDSYTTASANLRALTGNPCGMADQVLVEPDPNTGALRPIGTADISRALAGKSEGFDPNGVAGDLTPDSTTVSAGTINTGADPSRPFVVTGAQPGTTGGVGPKGVNGSTAALPFGLDPARTPVMGSYGHDNGTATLTSMPYALPARTASPLIVITAAGPVFSVDQDGVVTPGRSLTVEFGTSSASGDFRQIGPSVVPLDPGPDRPNRPWRNLRIPMSSVPAGATAMRIVAVDDNLANDQWLAFTPPRAPRLETLQNLVGSTAPVLLDLSVGSQFPCQHPITVTNGISQIPQWRITPDRTTTFSKSKSWQSATSGGGILTTADALTSASTMATYLQGDWYRDWGALQQLTPLVPDARPATVRTGDTTEWGWSRSGAIRVVSEND